MALRGGARTALVALWTVFLAGCQFPRQVDPSLQTPFSLTEVVEQALARGERVIRLPHGVYVADRPIAIKHSGVEIVGTGEVLVLSRVKGGGVGVFSFLGDQGRRLGSTVEPLRRGERAFRLSSVPRDTSGFRWVLLRYPNTEDFFNAIDSQVWRQDQPYLRHGIYQVQEVAGDRVVLSKGVEIDYLRARRCGLPTW